jgi:hypothetical protein
MVRATARLHRYDAARQLGRERHHALPPHPSAHHYTPGCVQSDNAAAVLAQVDPENMYVHRILLQLLARI